jgi:hypothetical protein
MGPLSMLAMGETAGEIADRSLTETGKMLESGVWLSPSLSE